MLEPQAQAFLAELEARGDRKISEMSPAEARVSVAELRKVFANRPLAVAGVTDDAVAGPHGPIPIRIYTPDLAGTPDVAGLPVVVYAHGGGWVLGDLEMVDGLARALANGAGCLVVSVDYRLAPEHPFPVPFDDVYAATEWVAANAPRLGADAARIAIGGDSAGGNLAAAVCLAARDRNGPPLCAQWLIYPAMDRRFDRPSYTAYAEGYFLTTDAMRWFWECYLGAAGDPNHPYAAPLRAATLHDLPPATVVLAGYDPLFDDGAAYAQRLRDAGVDVEVLNYEGMLHGFMTIGAFDRALEAIAASCVSLRAAFAAGGAARASGVLRP